MRESAHMIPPASDRQHIPVITQSFCWVFLFVCISPKTNHGCDIWWAWRCKRTLFHPPSQVLLDRFITKCRDRFPEHLLRHAWSELPEARCREQELPDLHNVAFVLSSISHVAIPSSRPQTWLQRLSYYHCGQDEKKFTVHGFQQQPVCQERPLQTLLPCSFVREVVHLNCRISAEVA